jgi:hypothetical protein
MIDYLDIHTHQAEPENNRVFSPEEVPEEAVVPDEGQNKKSTWGTIPYMPLVFGCHIASVVIRELV